MHEQRSLIEGRIRRFLEERIRPVAEQTVAPLSVAAHHVTNEGGVVGQGEPISRQEALTSTFEPFEWPAMWGPGWGTTWFKLTGQVPQEYRDAHLELVIDLSGSQADDGPGFQAEGMVYRPDGSIIKAINPKNRWIPVEMDADGSLECYVEAAANIPMQEGPGFGPTQRGDILTVGPQPRFQLGYAGIHLINDDVRELVLDLHTLFTITQELAEDSARRWELLIGMDNALNLLDLDNIVGSAASVRTAIAPLLTTPAPASAHHISAVGHAHIDTAWLWPIRETRRKIARTIANVLNLIPDHPEYIFALPAAQHAAWLESDYPDLFERMRAAVTQGHIAPVGGMWVEPDAVLPGSEAMCRQLLYGVRYFEEKLGVRCRGVWLPDSFGYSGALPQLARLAGMDWFLTQKISWNQVDKFPHHTFWWEGIDGTRIFTHFPPTDTYNADLGAGDLARAERNFRDKGHCNISMTPFGWGDGGGGPTREMLQRARRVANLEGSPKVTIETPDAFFDKAKAAYPDAETWVGELYLELHRATFTSQAKTKEGNRRNEALLHEAEWVCSAAAVAGVLDYPYDELNQIWQQVLVGQFHDILPGSSIAWVHRENAAMHAELSDQLRAIIARALQALQNEKSAVSVELVSDPAPVLSEAEGCFTLANDALTIVVDHRGLITSMIDKATGHELIPAGTVGNLLQLHQDFPNAWDAWDVDRAYLKTCVDIDAVDTITASMIDSVATVTVGRSFGKSTVTQTLRLAGGQAALESLVDVDWHEKEKFLKLAWPVDLHTTQARFETQFGHNVRAIHENTSWDAYRFEVNAHRWVQVAEGEELGLAVANERTYGWDVLRHSIAGERPHVAVRASLVRGPLYPDPETDQGEHSFRFLLKPTGKIMDAVALGYQANVREPEVAKVASLAVADDGLIIETIKLAEDRSGDVIVRIYEPRGVRCYGTVLCNFSVADVIECDLLEKPLIDDGRVDPTAILTTDGDRISVALRPFQVATLRVKRS